MCDRVDLTKKAEIFAMIRADESSKPKDESVCCDQYAIHFINPTILEFGPKHRYELIAADESIIGSIVAKVRYFDDFAKKLIEEGIEQLVILGAGYDTRAYRIGEPTGKLKVFEVDHSDAQNLK